MAGYPPRAGRHVGRHAVARHPLRTGCETRIRCKLRTGYQTMAGCPLRVGRRTMAGHHAMAGSELRTAHHAMARYPWCEGSQRRAYSAPGFAPQASTRPELPMVRGEREVGVLRIGFRAPGEYTPGTTEDGSNCSRPRRVHVRNCRLGRGIWDGPEDLLTFAPRVSSPMRVHARNYGGCAGNLGWD
jgi:hypothetical protein